MLLLFQILCIDQFKREKKKALTLTENLLNFNVTCMDPKQTFKRFLKMDALSSEFWELMRFYQFEF